MKKDYHTRGVGEFDTSDLPGGSRPNQEYWKKESPKKFKDSNVSYSTRPSRIFGGTVNHMEFENVNGYHVTINKYEEFDKLQVFIDSEDSSIAAEVTMDELDNYIKEHTK